MVRKTKQDALATRQHLLDTALVVFAEKGVSRTSLQDVAQAAGTTRGAIYWHFKNKADLFNAMMEQVILPMEQAMQQMGHDSSRDPLLELEDGLLRVLRHIADDPRVQAVFDVATLKVEYVDELLAVKQRHQKACQDATADIRRNLQEAVQRRPLLVELDLDMTAQGLHALVSGLIHTWMLAPHSFDLVAVAQKALRAQLRGLGLVPVPS